MYITLRNGNSKMNVSIAFSRQDRIQYRNNVNNADVARFSLLYTVYQITESGGIELMTLYQKDVVSEG